MDGTSKLQVNNPSITDSRRKLQGVIDPRYNADIVHYRGIPYATIPRRFAKPQVIDELPEENTDFTKFGPRCPQPKFDMRDFMFIPRTVPGDEVEEEDELKCANLNVTCPTATSATNLPVLFWIYGGAQYLTVGSAQQHLGDAGPLVAQSVEIGRPIILVTIHYRLNIFAFGDGKGEVNLQLQDQKAALQWVKRHIAAFGGDPDNITVGGESAGAVNTHALLASGAEFQRAILQSGSRYTTPPETESTSLEFVSRVETHLRSKNSENSSETTIAGASVATLIQSFRDLMLSRFWLWEEPYFKDWDNDKRVFGKLKGLLLGDTRDEWTLHFGALDKVPAKKLIQCFSAKDDPTVGEHLARIYGIDRLEGDDAAARRVALEYIADARFCAWSARIRANVESAGINAYQYHFDEPNPFATQTPQVGHGDDLFALFGGYNDHVGDDMRRVGRTLRTKWIMFVNGEEPWAKSETYVFGPGGVSAAIDRGSDAAVQELNPRRRQAGINAIQQAGWKSTREIWQNLLASARG